MAAGLGIAVDCGWQPGDLHCEAADSVAALPMIPFVEADCVSIGGAVFGPLMNCIVESGEHVLLAFSLTQTDVATAVYNGAHFVTASSLHVQAMQVLEIAQFRVCVGYLLL